MATRTVRGLVATLGQNARFEGIKFSLSSWLAAFLFVLLPSFVQRRLRPNQFKPRRLTPTSWLDGLRGVAAFVVYINHYTGRNFSKFQRAYGDYELVSWSSPLQLPFIRVIFCGLPMVHIFFVISGFALSYKPVRLFRARQHEQLFEALTSSIFRRGFRLFFPTVGSTFFIMVVSYFGIIGTPFPTLGEHLVDWYKALATITDAWSWDVLWYPPYDVHLWTIAIEFSHSMLLFVVIMGTSRMKTPLRMSFLFFFVIYCLRCGHWGPAEFISGMIIAEFTLIRSEARAAADGPLLPPSKAVSATRIVVVVFLILNLMMALFVAGWPNGKVEDMPGFSILYRNTMEPYWTKGGNVLIFPWYALGAVQIVMAVHQISLLQNLFITPVAQYLGDISFALYLMHGPTQVIMEPRWVTYIWALVVGTEEAGMWRYTIAWFLGITTLVIPTIWISDIFWRVVDVPSVNFARWFEKRCIHQEQAAYTAIPKTEEAARETA